MHPSNKLLSDLVASRTYAKYLPHLQRREILEETINRTMEMYLDRFPKLSREITKAFSKVHALDVMPSMRAVQFAGPPIDANNARAYNCSYTTLSHPRKFSEGLFLLLSGCGFGYSVQRHHINQLPKLQRPRDESRFLIPDSIEGWAMALDALMQAYFYRAVRPLFDYSLIRSKGTRLQTSGSKAPGPEPLKIMLQAVEKKLLGALDRKLKPLEAHDIMCLVSECVLAGGIRRAAMICLFDRDDKEMLKCKSGDWWREHPYRARANNSAVLPRWEVNKEEFEHIMKQCEDSKAGEPAIAWTSDKELQYGWNPCMEISLNPNQFCNLTTINLTSVRSEKDFLSRVHSATLIGTLQASFTDFPYVEDVWRVTTEREALLGVSMTGSADVPGLMIPELLERGARYAVDVNKMYAKRVGINPAARVTTQKPEGTVSCVLGSSSGIHARKARHYIRRFQISKDDALYSYLVNKIPDLVEDYRMGANTAVVSIPQESPAGAILEPEESASALLDRVLMYNKSWIAPGHVSGANKHNVSATLSIGPEEWDGVVKKLWKEREHYTGISCLPRDLGVYEQAPFEAITQEQYEAMNKSIPVLDLREVIELENGTALNETVACGGGACELTYLK